MESSVMKTILRKRCLQNRFVESFFSAASFLLTILPLLLGEILSREGGGQVKTCSYIIIRSILIARFNPLGLIVRQAAPASVRTSQSKGPPETAPTRNKAPVAANQQAKAQNTEIAKTAGRSLFAQRRQQTSAKTQPTNTPNECPLFTLSN